MTHLQNLQAELQKSGSAVLLSSEINQAYITDFRFSDGYVLVLPQKAYLVTDFRYTEAAEKTVDCTAIEVLEPSIGMLPAIREILLEAKIGEVLIEEKETSVSDFAVAEEKLGKEIALKQGASALLLALRAVKDEAEIARMTEAQRITDEAFTHILSCIKPNVTEREIALELEFFMRRAGAEGVAFDTIAVSGDSSSLPHGTPADRPLQKGFLTMDFGAKYRGYCADMTRTVVIGHADAEMKKVYNTVLSAQLAALQILKAGISGKDADKIARDIIDGAGYRGAFGHSLGHGVGLYIHESPNLSPRSQQILQAGNVVTDEPGIYLAGRYGCRIEDMVLIREDGILDFTHSPKDLIEL